MMIQVMVWWVVAGAIVIFGMGVFIGMVVMACCAVAGCADCRLAAKPVQIHVATEGGMVCAWADESGIHLRKEGER